jgi:hypothetical protein
MRPVERSEILDYETYEETRDQFRSHVMAEKARRRVHVGAHFTFLFENRLTVRYQVQEMMRTERIVKERDILHEIETYNALLGGDGELGCPLLVEIDDAEARAEKLRVWRGLPERVYARMEDGTIVRPSFDEDQRSIDRISSVQYLKFPVGGRTPAALGVDLPGVASETALSRDERAALAEDLFA